MTKPLIGAKSSGIPQFLAVPFMSGRTDHRDPFLRYHWEMGSRRPRVIEKPHRLCLSRAAELLEMAVEETLAYYAFSEEHCLIALVLSVEEGQHA